MHPKSKTTTHKSRFGCRKAYLVELFKSGLERRIARQIEDAGIAVEYETLCLPFLQPAAHRSYRPDFWLPNGIVIEAKGHFVLDDRKKHVLIHDQYPFLDIRLVFSNANNRISKRSKTTYADWCRNLEIPYSTGSIPTIWFDELVNSKSLSIIHDLCF